jgi:hypothetical protein
MSRPKKTIVENLTGGLPQSRIRGPVEDIRMGAGEFADRHGPAAGQFFDIVIGPRHVAMLVVDHSAAEVLDDVGRNAHLHERRAVLVDRRVLEHDLAAQRLGEFDRHLLMVHLDRTGKRNGRSEMSVGAFQDRRDGAALIIRGDRRMPSLARRDAQDPLFAERAVATDRAAIRGNKSAGDESRTIPTS